MMGSKIRGQEFLRVPIEKMTWKRKKATKLTNTILGTMILKDTRQRKLSAKRRTGRTSQRIPGTW
jgi:hypothetical protein